MEPTPDLLERVREFMRSPAPEEIPFSAEEWDWFLHHGWKYLVLTPLEKKETRGAEC